MKEYKRLTIKTAKGYLQPCQRCHKEARHLYCDIYDCAGATIQRLGELEDKIEQGRLVALPCKVGDTIYEIDNGGRIYETKIKNIIYDTDSVAFDERAIGNSIFLTKAEAETKLLEVESEK